jgi:putative inorganic carbon (hco3(-)) transporter
MAHYSDHTGMGGGLIDRLSPQVRTLLLFVGLILGSIIIAYLTVFVNLVLGIAILALMIGLPLVWQSFLKPLNALMLAVFTSYLIFITQRVTGIYDLPTGVVPDIMLVVGMLGILFKRRRVGSSTNNVITVLFIVVSVYLVIQVLNPYAFSTVAWFQLALRAIFISVCVYVLSVHAFNSVKAVKVFTIVCLALALVAALYGVWQEQVGLPPWDKKWIMSDPTTYKLTFINGKFRKWSILGEVSSFGVIMAYSAVLALVLALGPYRLRNRIILLVSAIIMMVAMGYSGTRTATVMIPSGLALYILLTISNKRTLIFTVVSIMTFVVLIYGPIYGPNMSRLRTAFRPSEDASMQVREENRDRIRPYMHSHPFGGGIGTTGPIGRKMHPGHTLAGFPPDSGYMKTVLETGYVGLFLNLLLYFVALSIGVKNYYKTRDPVVKNLYVAYMASFFAISIGNLTQNTMAYPPADIINICIYVMMFKLITFETNPISSANEND